MADRDLKLRLIFDAVDKASAKMTKIDKSTTAMARAIRATGAELRKLEKAQSDLKSFRVLKRGAAETEKAIGAAQVKVSKLAAEIGKADKPTRELTRDFERAKREAAELRTKHADETEQLQKLRDRMRAAGLSTRDLVAGERRLRDEVSRTTDKLKGQQAELARRRQGDGARGGGRSARESVTAGVVKGGLILGSIREVGELSVTHLKAAADFQSVMTDIAIKSNMTRVESEKFGRIIERVAPVAGRLPQDFAAGVDILAGKGLDPSRALRAMQPIGRAATAYKAEIEDLANATFAGIDNLKVPIAQTSKMLDVMAQAGKAGSFEVKDMAAEFPALTAAAQAFGQKGIPAIADLAAAAQIARTATGDSSTAANNLANLLAKINAEEVQKNFKGLGVDLPAALKRAYAEGKTPLEAIAEVSNRALKGDLSKLGTLFGDQQAQSALRPLIQKIDEYRRIRAQAMAASGTVDADFAQRMGDVQSRWDRLAAVWQRILIIGGRNTEQVTDPLLDGLANKGERFASWIEANRTARQRVEDIWSTLPAWVRTVGNGLQTAGFVAGTMTGQGLGEGILSTAGRVVAAIDSLALRMGKAIRAKLGIRSPSRVFAEIGRFTSLGLAMGIDQESHAPVKRVETIAGRMRRAIEMGSSSTSVSAALSTSSAGRTAATAAAVTIHAPITINQLPGENGDQLARRIADELDRRTRSAAAARRSSYRDDA